MLALINGVNLLPLPGLDGGQICGLLSRKINVRLANLLMWSTMAALLTIPQWSTLPVCCNLWTQYRATVSSLSRPQFQRKQL